MEINIQNTKRASAEGRRQDPVSETLAWDVLFNLVRAYKLWRKHIETRHIEATGLTEPQAGVIEALGRLGPLPLGEIGRNMLVTAGNIVGIIDRLEKIMLVERTREAGDRRVVTITLTEKGRQGYRKAVDIVVAEIEKATEKFSALELTQFLNLLFKLAASIKVEADK